MPRFHPLPRSGPLCNYRDACTRFVPEYSPCCVLLVQGTCAPSGTWSSSYATSSIVVPAAAAEGDGGGAGVNLRRRHPRGCPQQPPLAAAPALLEQPQPPALLMAVAAVEGRRLPAALQQQQPWRQGRQVPLGCSSGPMLTLAWGPCSHMSWWWQISRCPLSC
jgi:hypothetical protein